MIASIPSLRRGINVSVSLRRSWRSRNIDSVSDGELYWPLSLLPEEYSLLADGQFVSLRVSGRIKGDKSGGRM